jgi:folate-dependent phosphoribosylglycinamide formyltransferase PurN
MVHEVIPEIDAGKVIVEKKVEIKKEDDLEALETRVHQTEHVAIVEAVQVIIQNKKK